VASLALLALLLLASCPTNADAARASKSPAKSEEKLKRREAREARKMAAKKRRKEVRRAEKKRRIVQKVKDLKKEKKKLNAKKIKPLTAKGLKAAQDKMNFMMKKSKGATESIISLNSKTYKRYINNGPRGYYTLLVYTALASEYQCSICQSMHKEMVKLTRATNLTEHDPPIFVASLDYSDGMDIFQELRFRHVPIAVLIPPTNSSKKPDVMQFYKKIPQNFRMGSTGRLGADDFANFIQRNTPVENISIPQPMPKIYKYVGLTIVAVIALYLLVTGLYYKNVLKYRDFTLPYLLLVLIFYAWCAGAGMYNIIRSTNWHGGSPKNPEYFYPGSGSQYIYGSMIVGATNLMVGLSVVLLNSWALPDEGEKAAKSWLTTIARFLFRLLFNPWVVMILVIYIWYNLLGIYTRKNHGYNYGAIPDHELFDSAEFYKKSVKWFKRTLLGKNLFRYYRKGNRAFWRFYRKSLEESISTYWGLASKYFNQRWAIIKPSMMGKLSDFQRLVDENVLGVKDEL